MILRPHEQLPVAMHGNEAEEAASARKMFVSHLARATVCLDHDDCWTYLRKHFARCWLQGVVVSRDELTVCIDDGSGVIEVELEKTDPAIQNGSEIMVMYQMRSTLSSLCPLLPPPFERSFPRLACLHHVNHNVLSMYAPSRQRLSRAPFCPPLPPPYRRIWTCLLLVVERCLDCWLSVM